MLGAYTEEESNQGESSGSAKKQKKTEDFLEHCLMEIRESSKNFVGSLESTYDLKLSILAPMQDTNEETSK